MPKINFTPLAIQHIKPGERPTEYFDASREHGDGLFGVRVSPKGKMVWFIMYSTHDGIRRRYPLGNYPDVSLKDARRQANEIFARIKDGIDPQHDRQEYKGAPLVTDLWRSYRESLDNRQTQKANSTISEEVRRWENVVSPAIGHLKVEDVQPSHLYTMLNRVAKKAPVSANRLHSFLQVLFKPALAQGWITVHPLQWIDKPGGAEAPRKRFLSDDEIRAIWPKFDTLRPNPRDILKIGLLTAQRPGEIYGMVWDDIDLDRGIWIIRESKTDKHTGNDHLVPLSPQALAILQARKDGEGYTAKQQWMIESRYVFPTKYNRAKGMVAGHAKTTKEARKKIQQLSGVTGWTAHDLRRTARTLMSRLSIDHHIRERVLNHSQGGVHGVYDRYDYLQDKADALRKLANEIDRILGTEKPAKVVQLMRRRLG